MPLSTRNLKQNITWWKLGAINAFGQVEYAAPVEITGRWEDDRKLFTDSNGKQVHSEAVVFVDRRVTEGDYLFLGTSGAIDPKQVTGAKEIRKFQAIPALRADDTQFEVML